MKLKYIRYNDIDYAMFPPHIEHIDMAKRLNIDVVDSAGYVDIPEIKFEGESVSLDINSKPDEDLRILQAMTK